MGRQMILEKVMAGIPQIQTVLNLCMQQLSFIVSDKYLNSVTFYMEL